MDIQVGDRVRGTNQVPNRMYRNRSGVCVGVYSIGVCAVEWDKNNVPEYVAERYPGDKPFVVNIETQWLILDHIIIEEDPF